MPERRDSDSRTHTCILMEAEACRGASLGWHREVEASGTLGPSGPCRRTRYVGSTQAARTGASHPVQR